MKRVYLRGLGAYVGDRTLTNADLVRAGAAKSEDWILARTGIEERRIAPDLTLTELAEPAARNALAGANLRLDDIDLIVAAGDFHDVNPVLSAALLKSHIGMPNARCLDLRAGCPAAGLAVDVAAAYVRGELANEVLVCVAEPNTRGETAFNTVESMFFGDGGAAACVSGVTGFAELVASFLDATGENAEILACPSGGSRCPLTPESLAAGEDRLRMNGRAVREFAIEKLPLSVRAVCARAGIEVADLAYIVPHQANLRLLENGMEQLGLPVDRLVTNIQKIGNTAGPSMLIALAEAARAGMFHRGDFVCLPFFGAGLAWGAHLIRWGGPEEPAGAPVRYHQGRNDSALRRTAADLRSLRSQISTWAAGTLGMPVSHAEEQIAFAADSIEALSRTDPGDAPGQRRAALLFPSNGEGAMAVYLTVLAWWFGFEVEIKLPTRHAGLVEILRTAFRPLRGISIAADTGAAFLRRHISDPRTALVQVFGTDDWIDAYEDAVRHHRVPLFFEGPGKDPFILLPGGDFNAAVIGAVNSGLFAAGQACMSPERFLVPAASVQDFREALVSAFAEWPQGDPFSREIRLGLIADGRIVEEVQRQVREAVSAGAKVVHGGQIRELSVAGITMWELQPTILVGVTSDMDMMQRETMAPIFPVYGYRTVEEAMTVAEGTRYGLTATVFGRGQVYRDAAQRLARSHGLVFQNVDMVAGFEPQHWGSGGFKRSGWIWEWRDGAFVRREGRRDLSAEWHRIATGAK